MKQHSGESRTFVLSVAAVVALGAQCTAGAAVIERPSKRHIIAPPVRIDGKRVLLARVAFRADPVQSGEDRAVRAISNPVEITVEKPWGEAVEGVRLHLVVDKDVENVQKIPFRWKGEELRLELEPLVTTGDVGWAHIETEAGRLSVRLTLIPRPDRHLLTARDGKRETRLGLVFQGNVLAVRRVIAPIGDSVAFSVASRQDARALVDYVARESAKRCDTENGLQLCFWVLRRLAFERSEPIPAFVEFRYLKLDPARVLGDTTTARGQRLLLCAEGPGGRQQNEVLLRRLVGWLPLRPDPPGEWFKLNVAEHLSLKKPGTYRIWAEHTVRPADRTGVWSGSVRSIDTRIEIGPRPDGLLWSERVEGLRGCIRRMSNGAGLHVEVRLQNVSEERLVILPFDEGPFNHQREFGAALNFQLLDAKGNLLEAETLDPNPGLQRLRMLARVEQPGFPAFALQPGELYKTNVSIGIGEARLGHPHALAMVRVGRGQRLKADYDTRQFADVVRKITGQSIWSAQLMIPAAEIMPAPPQPAGAHTEGRAKPAVIVPARGGEEPPWGEAVEGVQVRLRADKKVWTFGRVPTLKADVLNGSKRKLQLQGYEFPHCHLEVDRTWYRGGIGADKRLAPLMPSRSVNGIRVRLVGSGRAIAGFQDLRLGPGKHVVRVGFQMRARRAPDEAPWFRPISNRVEIMIERALPGSGLSIKESVKGKFAFAALCEALAEPTPVVGSFTGRFQTLARQQFKVLKDLGGVSTPNYALELLYAYVHDSRAQERPVKKGERVICIVHNADREGLWSGAKALTDTPENRKAVIEAVKEEAAWGPVSNGLQCRLLPLEQTVEVAEGAKPEDIEVHVTYELRNVGKEPVKFLPWSTPLFGPYGGRFNVIGPDGKKVEFRGVWKDLGSPKPDSFVSVAAGQSLARSVRLPYDFTKTGVYRVSASAKYQTAHQGGWIADYYGGDVNKARQNPDNVWTGTLRSNAVTVTVVARRPQEATCSGKVVDPNGRPIRGVSMETYHRTVDDSLLSARFAGELTTKEDGAFSFSMQTDQSQQPGQVEIFASKQGFALGCATWVLDRNQEVTVQLREPDTLAGTVVDEAGRGVQGAEIRALLAVPLTTKSPGPYAQIFGVAPFNRLAVKTDAEGRFVFDNIPPRAKAELLVTAPGRAKLVTGQPLFAPNALQYSAGQTDIRIVLPVEARISGVLADKASGRRIAGQELLVSLHGPGSSFARSSCVSADDGAFSVGALCAGMYYVALVPPRDGLADWVAAPVYVKTKSGETTGNVRIELGRGGILETVVTDTIADRPVEGVRVVVDARRIYQGGHAWTDRDGRCRVRLTPAKCFVTGYKKGYKSSGTHEVTIVEGETSHLAFPMAQFPEVRGVVLDPAGKPVPGASVQIGAFGSLSITDAAGRFEVKKWPGRCSERYQFWLLVVHRERNLARAIELGDGPQTIDVMLRPAVTITGRVVDSDARPVPGAKIEVMWHTSGYADYGKPLTADADGRYELNALPPGQAFCLRASADGHGRSTAEIRLAEEHDQHVEMEDLVIRRAYLSVSGRVVGDEGKPVAGIFVGAHGEGQPYRRAKTDANGGFTIANMCKGTVYVTVLAQMQGISGHVRVEAGARDVKIVVQKPSRYVPPPGSVIEPPGSADLP